ncbi:MAG: class I SAM-dependent DNA methyltransferase [Acidimicrobiia bacterium]
MGEYDARTYGRIWAEEYDRIFPEADPAQIDLLASLAGDPPKALELAIGTGRLALPLRERGVEVSGIDISEEMVAKLREKPGGEAMEVVLSDFADVEVDGKFPLIYLAFNTLFGLLTQERQMMCFANVADHLEPGGSFVIDCFVPDMTRFDKFNTRAGVFTREEEPGLELTVHQPAAQRVRSTIVRFLDEGTRRLPVEIRYSWPAELDLMARLAGLALEERWEWYDKTPFTDASTRHVSVYRKPG